MHGGFRIKIVLKSYLDVGWHLAGSLFTFLFYFF
jgi:hypothetical protein